MALKIQRAGDAARRLNVFAYGPAGAGKTWFALTFPNPVLVDFEDGSLTAETMGKGDIPMLQPSSYSDVQRILEAPDVVASEIADQCNGYEVKTWIFDSATSMGVKLLGAPASEWRDGYGLLSEQRNRTDPMSPTIEDYKLLNLEMVSFFNLVRQMPYHTVITAHAGLDRTEDSPKGLNVKEDKVRYSGFPILTGALKYGAGNLADLYIYMDTRPKGTDVAHFAHLRKIGSYNARHRLGPGVPPSIEDPNFTKLWTIYEQRRENVEN